MGATKKPATLPEPRPFSSPQPLHHPPMLSSSTPPQSLPRTSCSDLCFFRVVAHDNICVVCHHPDNDYGTRLLPTANSTRATQYHLGRLLDGHAVEEAVHPFLCGFASKRQWWKWVLDVSPSLWGLRCEAWGA